jgi:hypothetical protein
MLNVKKTGLLLVVVGFAVYELGKYQDSNNQLETSKLINTDKLKNENSVNEFKEETKTNLNMINSSSQQSEKQHFAINSTGINDQIERPDNESLKLIDIANDNNLSVAFDPSRKTIIGAPSKIEYINKLNLDNINSLFELMQRQETNYSAYLKNLNLMIFKDLVDDNMQTIDKKSAYKRFEKEIEQYLIVEDDKVHANRHFFDHLTSISDKYTTNQFNVTAYQMNLPEVVFQFNHNHIFVVVVVSSNVKMKHA